MNTSLYACGPPSWLPGILKRVSRTPVATRQMDRFWTDTCRGYCNLIKQPWRALVTAAEGSLTAPVICYHNALFQLIYGRPCE